MGESWHSATFTTEFGHEFEAERGQWLRRRFLWYTGVVVVLGLLGMGVGVVTMLLGRGPSADYLRSSGQIANTVIGVVSMAIYVWAFLYVRRRSRGHATTLSIAYWLIVINGLLSIAAAVIQAEWGPRVGADPERTARLVVVAGGLSQIFMTHFFACLFLPWTPKESVRPLVPLFVAQLLVMVVYVRSQWVQMAVLAALMPMTALPGAFICWWRHSRFRDRFTTRMIRGKYNEMRRELVDARRIHEALFPSPNLSGPVRFTYRYEPMRQIGGDYLYCHRPPAGGPGAGTMSVVLIDVTGHGIPAALTVNRLHGELERVFAENHDVGPGEVLRLLNRYVHLTLATHSVYVTALCLRVDPATDTLEYASGGHPPAFLRAVDGTIDQLDSTAFVLGACAGEDFEPEPRSLRFGPGDTLVAYTDGAIEARDSGGRMLGINGLRRLIAAGRPESGWAVGVLRAVEQHRKGPPDDDTLVIELHRPVQESEPEVMRSRRIGRVPRTGESAGVGV